MKKIILAGAITLASALSFAQVVSASPDFSVKAAQLLLKDAKKIKLTGDVRQNEQLSPILFEVRRFIQTGGSEGVGNMSNSRVANVQNNCEVFPRGIAAKCFLTIQYRPIGETSVMYVLGLDGNKMPATIMENRADVSRGD